MTYREIDDPRKWRISMSGFSIKTGWGDEKNIVERYPGSVGVLDVPHYAAWLEEAQRKCDEHNAELAEGK